MACTDALQKHLYAFGGNIVSRTEKSIEPHSHVCKPTGNMMWLCQYVFVLFVSFAMLSMPIK